MSATIMAHLVAGYPTDELALAAAQALVAGGVSYLEVQLPFSDPSADGPAIQEACAMVLKRGYTISDGLAFIASLREACPNIPIWVMTYANLAYHAGIDRFVHVAADHGVAGLIIPDLPFDHDEGLRNSCRAHAIEMMPVAAPSMTAQRIELLRSMAYPWIYAALRAGITGSETIIEDSILQFLDALRGDARLVGGFGIRHASQVSLLSCHVHAVVAGSVFVDILHAVSAQGPDAVRSAIEKKARELTFM